jgi:hypothetical protein
MGITSAGTRYCAAVGMCMPISILHVNVVFNYGIYVKRQLVIVCTINYLVRFVLQATAIKLIGKLP